MRIKNITFSLPQLQSISFIKPGFITRKYLSFFKRLLEKFSGWLHLVIAKMKEFKNARKKSLESADHIRRPRVDLQKFVKPAKLLLLILVAVGILAGASSLIKNIFSSQSDSSDRFEVKSARAEQILDKEYQFPLFDDKNEEIAKIKYIIEKAEIRDEIIVKGQRATSVKGRTFLILTLKITNEYKSDIEIKTRDYIRLSVNKNEDEWLAPEIHNDPVEVQAISTKFARVGFAINESDKDFLLRVGEVNGEKQELPLEIKP